RGLLRAHRAVARSRASIQSYEISDARDGNSRAISESVVGKIFSFQPAGALDASTRSNHGCRSRSGFDIDPVGEQGSADRKGIADGRSSAERHSDALRTGDGRWHEDS